MQIIKKDRFLQIPINWHTSTSEDFYGTLIDKIVLKYCK